MKLNLFSPSSEICFDMCLCNAIIPACIINSEKICFMNLLTPHYFINKSKWIFNIFQDHLNKHIREGVIKINFDFREHRWPQWALMWQFAKICLSLSAATLWFWVPHKYCDNGTNAFMAKFWPDKKITIYYELVV